MPLLDLAQIKVHALQLDGTSADHAHDNNEGPGAAGPPEGNWRDQGV